MADESAMRPKIAGAYDQWHRIMDSGNRDPLQFPWYAAVADGLGHSVNGEILEIGCGRGEFAIWMTSAFKNVQVTGVDFSTTAIRIANRNITTADPKMQFVVGDAQALPFPNNRFDCVVSCECMEHVPSPQAMATEISRVLKPGGKFFLTTENYLNGMIMAWLHCWASKKPFNSGSGLQPIENFFLFFMVKKYLLEAGLLVDRTESSHYQWLLLPRVDPARLCTAQFRRYFLRRIAKPFGRHFSFFGHKP